MHFGAEDMFLRAELVVARVTWRPLLTRILPSFRMGLRIHFCGGERFG
ncbi:hypothetical protein HanRHA438_Chr10g0459351 [Helianthus annuus]|nr:hypothetical protein HanIR_Chr10g0481651 [Helianthus annuus]KAJ0880099.1 hypothetical protein HanRHA438_Chr10g0459351 [Helianthus annuus]